tara:strand:+ start:351 stop:527 length:177 start_codon:yes stop_codon:yes gene_type:complete
MKTVLLGLIVALLWSSPQARTTTANGLRMAANWLDPKEEPTKNPKHITIPNPLYVEQE